MVRPLAKSQYPNLLPLMFEYKMLPIQTSNISDACTLQIVEHFTISLPSMLHYMVIGHSIQVEMTNMGKALRRYDKLFPVKPRFVGMRGTDTLEITNPKIVLRSVQVSKWIGLFFYRRACAKARIEKAVRKIDVTSYSKHIISFPDDSTNHR